MGGEMSVPLEVTEAEGAVKDGMAEVRPIGDETEVVALTTELLIVCGGWTAHQVKAVPLIISVLMPAT